jgi:ferredoxin
VYGVGTPAIMLNYLSKLECVAGCSAAIISTSAGLEGQSLYHVQTMLKKKGFQVFLMDMVIYTYNFTQILNPPTKEEEKKVFKEAQIHIATITEQILQQERVFKKRNYVFLLFSWIVFTLYYNLGRRFLGKVYIADASCNGCQVCNKVCPVKAIHMRKGKPNWSFQCEGCERCINMCPQQSIQLSVVKLLLFVVFQIVAPFFIIGFIPYLAQLHVLIRIILYFVIAVVGTILAFGLIHCMEQFKITRKLLCINYTSKFRRNIAEGFHI